ncbi:hypothetical protein EHR02_00025 [Leptospira levettii]|uniref:hypothetical protein n=1 Tax=Leptospira levettii TaxID=2023178 RepID=UPI001084298D|nr:hypothetical protein [Leptospira levettii]TGM95024.1 hypothetical protein EHR02_00025 [Leptospira levettii]
MKTQKIKVVEKVKRISSDEEYEIALQDILNLMVKKKSEDEKSRYGALIEAVKEFENKTYGRHKVDLPNLINFEMKQKDLTQNQLAILLGDAPLTSKLLKGKAEISKKVAIILNRHLNIPFEVLFQEEIERETKAELSRMERAESYSGRGRKSRRELVKH